MSLGAGWVRGDQAEGPPGAEQRRWVRRGLREGGSWFLSSKDVAYGPYRGW